MEITQFNSFEEAMNGLRNFELETESQYVVNRRTKHFNKTYVPTTDELKKSRIWYSGSTNIIGPLDPNKPFIVVGSLDLSCVHGKPKCNAPLEVCQETGDHQYKKKRKMIQPSKKLGCPSVIKIQEVLAFDGYEATTKKTRVTTSQKLKKSDTSPSTTRWFLMGHKNDHCNHVTGKVAGLNRRLGRGLVDKIHDLVSSGSVRVPEVKCQLEKVVDHLPLTKNPSLLNRQYYPSNKTIYNHIQIALSNNRYSDEEQSNVQLHLEKLTKDFPGVKYSFRAHSEPDGQKFLVVIQCDWQQRLVERFGDVVLVDSTFNTSKYQLPLFEVVIRTNVGYSPVAIIITEDETEALIEEGLRILLSWNDGWRPSVLLTDSDMAQIIALQNVFPDSSIRLCQFHRELAWKRWLSRSDNRLTSEKDDILNYLRCIANSISMDEFENNLERLKSSEVWRKNDHLQNYLGNTWLNVPERWVRAFRDLNENITATTTNGVEVHHRILKNLLEQQCSRTAQGLVDVIVTKYFPGCMSSYTERNIKPKPSSKSYNKEIPSFLQGRPKNFVEHCLARLTDASSYHYEDLTTVSCTKYRITSQSDPRISYFVQLDLPFCECIDFLRHYLPCKHMMAIFILHDAWKHINPRYSQSKYYTLNDEFLNWVNAAPDQAGKDLLQPHPEPFDNLNKGRLCDTSATLQSQSGLQPSQRQKANTGLKRVQNYINNTNNLDAVTYASELLEKCMDSLLQKHGNISTFSDKSTATKKGPLVVPACFVKKRRLTKRLQKIITASNVCGQDQSTRIVKKAKLLLRKVPSKVVIDSKTDVTSAPSLLLSKVVIDHKTDVTSAPSLVPSNVVIDHKTDVTSAPSLVPVDADQMSDSSQPDLDGGNQMPDSPLPDWVTSASGTEQTNLPSPVTSAPGTEQTQLPSPVPSAAGTEQTQLPSPVKSAPGTEQTKLPSPVDDDQMSDSSLPDVDGGNQMPDSPLPDWSHLISVVKKRNVKADVPDTENHDPIILDIDEIWSRHIGSASVMAVVAGYKLYGKSFATLKSGNRVSDEIINSYIKSLIEQHACAETGFIDCLVMSNILNHPTEATLMKKMSFGDYAQIICPLNTGGHWVLIVLFPRAFELLYVNPLGEHLTSANSILGAWKTFITRRFAAGLEHRHGPSKWTLATVPPHSKQTDSVSCGIFVMKFAELLLQGNRLVFPNRCNDVNQMRREIAAILLANCGNVTNVCRKCSIGYIPDEDWIQCSSCHWWHHYWCTGVSRSMSSAGHDSFFFLCDTCQEEACQVEVDDDDIDDLSFIIPTKKRRLPFTSTPGHPSTSSDRTQSPGNNRLPPTTYSSSTTIEPFVLCKLTNQIKICAGCRGNFIKPVKEPTDIIIFHREFDSFYDKRIGEMRRVFQKKYYHPSANCLQSKHPSFKTSSICLPPAIQLTNQHIAYLASLGLDISACVNRIL